MARRISAVGWGGWTLGVVLALPASHAGTLHACRQAGVTSYQATPCAMGAREVRRIAYEPEQAAAPARPHRIAATTSRSSTTRSVRMPRGERVTPDACAQARTARERLLGANQQGGSYAQRTAAHEAVADACY